jgi:hypothetical protein
MLPRLTDENQTANQKSQNPASNTVHKSSVTPQSNSIHVSHTQAAA